MATAPTSPWNTAMNNRSPGQLNITIGRNTQANPWQGGDDAMEVDEKDRDIEMKDVEMKGVNMKGEEEDGWGIVTLHHPSALSKSPSLTNADGPHRSARPSRRRARGTIDARRRSYNLGRAYSHHYNEFRALRRACACSVRASRGRHDSQKGFSEARWSDMG
ncbi:hypothetical protein C8Q80DRAFT_1347315 [Daedaleopsis nitida]|nr:hypothetical protein C8Q80DRAFT_1347315 [Daedaleopsis nitida]